MNKKLEQVRSVKRITIEVSAIVLVYHEHKLIIQGPNMETDGDSQRVPDKETAAG